MSGYRELPCTGPAEGTPKQLRLLPDVTAALALAVVQVVLGLVLQSLGCVVAASNLSSTIRSTGAGIWIGVWVCIAGLVGLRSVRRPSNSCLSGVYLAMNIITTIAVVTVGVKFASGSAFDTDVCGFGGDCDGSRRVYGALIGLAAIEWFVALTAAILSCNRGCCGTQRGTVLQQPGVISGSGADILIISHTSIGMVGQDAPHPSYASPAQQPYQVSQTTNTGMAGQMTPPPSYTYPAQQPYTISQPTNTGMTGQMSPQASYGSPGQQTYTIGEQTNTATVGQMPPQTSYDNPALQTNPVAPQYGTVPRVLTNYHDNYAPGALQPTFPATAQSGFLPSQSNVTSAQQPANYHHSQPATWTTFSAPVPSGNLPSQPTASNTHRPANHPLMPAWSTPGMVGYPGWMAPPPYTK